jgi:Tol biopolymer transport system component/DNA-binding winged helix-turn-helix (wHTH) protein
MASSPPPTQVARFGEFSADFQTGELFRNGSKLKLHGQPFEILAVLLEHPGRLVTREELRRRLWPSDTFVDFEHGLNAAVNRLREVLGDSADQPRFIETVPRRGYKFIAALSNPPDPQRSPTSSHSIRRPILLAGLGMLAILVLTVATLWFRATRSPKVTSWTQLSFGKQAIPRIFATDGSRIYFTARKNSTRVAYVSIKGGDYTLLNLPFQGSALESVSPDGSMLLIATRREDRVDEGLLWLVPAAGGGPRRLSGNGGHDGAWSLDGRHLVYAFDQDLYMADGDGENARKLVALTGKPFWIRWSPDSARLRFTVSDPNNGENNLWECRSDGSHLHRLSFSGKPRIQECCGEWTPDGRYFLFTRARDNLRPMDMHGEIYAIRDSGLLAHLAKASPLTNGPLDMIAAVSAPGGKKLFVLAKQTSAELFKYDLNARKISPYLSGVSTGEAATSPDGRWVAYAEMRGQDSILWRSKADGSDRIQLTFPPVQAGWVSWSPDSKQITYFAKRPDGPWRIYLVSVNGGTPRALSPQDHSYVDPEWSPDGHSLMFGRTPNNWWLEVPDAKTISILNLDTSQITTLPGSQGLFSGRWSPN